jgi:hypothetical protein
MAVLTLATALRMEEPFYSSAEGKTARAASRVSVRKAWAQTVAAGRFILTTPFALAVILAGLICDSVSRMLITLSSQYYRLIQLPEASFGIIGSAVAALGLFVPRLALGLSSTWPPARNLAATAAVIAAGLAGTAFFLPIVGLVPAFVVFAGLYLTGFFTSHYLNQITDSRQRATVLSFKGLCFNLAYGGVGLLYSLLLYSLRSSSSAGAGPAAGGIENAVFRSSLAWFPWVFALAMGSFALFARRLLKNPPSPQRTGQAPNSP